MSGYIGVQPIPTATRSVKPYAFTAPFDTVEVVGGYVVNNIDVHVNGLYIEPTAYTANNGTQIVFSEELSASVEEPTVVTVTEVRQFVVPNYDADLAPWLGTAVRELKFMHITDLAQLPPKDNQLYRYILLSADEAGVGQYNEDVLINQATDSSSGREDITAEINLPASPMHGQTVRLVNSMEAFFKMGELAGAFSADQMQRIVGTVQQNVVAVTSDPTGVYSDTPEPAGDAAAAGVARRYQQLDFNSANSPDARTSATTEGATEPLSVTVVALLRIL